MSDQNTHKNDNGNEARLKSGFVAILGRPNVGKSTLMNQLVGQKIAITANKPQTTRSRIRAIFTDENRGQIVFLDTPGIHKAKNKLGEFMMDQVSCAMADSDIILWLVEPETTIGGGDKKIAERLAKSDIPVILVINKTDTIAHDEVLPVIAAWQDLIPYAEIVPLSARKGDGCDILLEQVFKYLPYGPMYYDADEVTDQPMRAIVAEVIREKSLHALRDEVPHGIAVVIDEMKWRERSRNSMSAAAKKSEHRKGQKEDFQAPRGLYDIAATIVCERDTHKGIIIGKGGSMLKKIGSNSRYEIEQMLEEKVNLKLFVKVRENWRDSDMLLKNFGYEKE
ncbi:MAG: GTPase Era [Lachnospiraceae bacterium]|nr:GTPase Era [Lachnospiraceae bacterium]